MADSERTSDTHQRAHSYAPTSPPPMSWQASLQLHVDALTFTLSQIDESSVAELRDMLLGCTGTLFFTGVGKNGFVAAKLASTYNSLAIKSFYLDPVDCLHGSLNLVTSSDIVIALSSSGNTDELLVFIDAAKRIAGARVVAVTCARSSKLSAVADLALFVPCHFEADHLNLAPTATSICLMATLQSLAVDISSTTGFTRRDFLRSHPGGTLGKKGLAVPVSGIPEPPK